MNYFTEGDLVEIVSLDGVNTERTKSCIGSIHEVYEVNFFHGIIKVGFNKYLDFGDIKLVQKAPKTEYTIEQFIGQKAVSNYRQAQADNKRIEEILETKAFHLNDYVVDVNFGIGKIVGWDEEYEYYRVRFNDNLRFIGREEDDLIPYEGEVPKELADYDPNVVNYVWGFYLDDTVAEDMED